MLNKTKQKHYHNLFQKYANKPYEQLKTINNLTGQKEVQLTKVRLSDGQVEQSPHIVTNMFKIALCLVQNS